MGSDFLFEMDDGYQMVMHHADQVITALVKDACHRLRARVGSGKTMVRVEVKRIKD